MNESLLVSPDWLGDHLRDPDVRVVDTRGKADFTEQHIAGAVNLPSGSLFDPESVSSVMRATAELEETLSNAGIDAESRLVLYDDSGLVPSAKVFWVLEHLGRSRMALLDGGFPAWTGGKLPTESGYRRPQPATFRTVSENVAHNVANREDVLRAIKSADTLIIDSRSPDEYHGRTDAHPRNGHIPGARNLDWQHHIIDLFDPTFVPTERLAHLYREIGATVDQPVITYCRTASRSSHAYFALRLLGFEKVKNYSGSWMEWCADESLPIE